MLTAPLETSRPKPFGCSGKKLRRVSYTRTRQASSRPFRPLTLECTCRVCSSLYRKPLTALCAALKKIGRGPNFTRASTSSRAGPSGVCLEPTPHCWKADAWELFTMSSATITSKRVAQFMEQKELCEQPDVPISCPVQTALQRQFTQEFANSYMVPDHNSDFLRNGRADDCVHLVAATRRFL